MSIKIDSILDTSNDFWKVSLEGELDVSTADELKKYLHKLVDEKNINIKYSKSWIRKYNKINYFWDC